MIIRAIDLYRYYHLKAILLSRDSGYYSSSSISILAASIFWGRIARSLIRVVVQVVAAIKTTSFLFFFQDGEWIHYYYLLSVSYTTKYMTHKYQAEDDVCASFVLKTQDHPDGEPGRQEISDTVCTYFVHCIVHINTKYIIFPRGTSTWIHFLSLFYYLPRCPSYTTFRDARRNLCGIIIVMGVVSSNIDVLFDPTTYTKRRMDTLSLACPHRNTYFSLPCITSKQEVRQ